MKNNIVKAILITSIAMAPFQAVNADSDGKISLESGLIYSTGKYGGTQSTDIMYFPVTGKYQGRSWTMKLTVPYLQITGPSNVINVINGVALTGTPTSNSPLTRSGLGDVVATATYNAYNGGSSGPMFNLTGKIKFGTANKAQGLGTGEKDYALQTELYHVTGNLATFETLGYRVYGSPAGYTLNNAFYGSLGSSYKFSQQTNAGLMLNLGQKVTSTGAFHLETLFFVSHTIEKSWKAQGYVIKGFTNSVPSWGVGATAAYLL